MRASHLGLVAIAALGLCAACKKASVQLPGTEKEKTSMPTTTAVELTSPAFSAGQNIPATHTCDAEDQSPPLQWKGVPAGAKTIAIICDDPDAPSGTWVHWVIYGIDATVNGLAEGVEKTGKLSNGERQGKNDFNQIGYNGPCPPRGKPHRYFFKLYALDIDVAAGPGATKADLMNAMEGHVLAGGELMGTYQRKQ